MSKELKRSMATARHVTRHAIQDGGNAHEVLVNDLRSIIRSVESGVAIVTSRAVPKTKRNVWVIKGPEKDPILVLHYRNNFPFVGKTEEEEAIANLNDDDVDPKPTSSARATHGPVTSSDDLNNCKAETRDLPSNFKVKSEETAIPYPQTWNDENIAARDCAPTFSSSDVAALKSPTEQQFQPSFINAADEHFVVDSENGLDPCHQISQQDSRPCIKLENGSETYNQSASTISIVDNGYQCGSTEGTSLCRDSILENKVDVDRQLSSSWMSQNKKVCSLDKPEKDPKTHLDKCVDENELGQNITNMSTGIALKDCSVVVKPLARPASTLKKLETGSTTYRLPNAIKSAHTVKTGRQYSQQCRYCGRAFHYLVILKLHEKRRVCQQVNEDLKHSKNNERSLLWEKEGIIKHGVETSFRSKVSFKRLQYLKGHEKNHGGERSYQCSFCDKKFRTNRSRKVHERTHTGEKPHRCSFCDKKFSTSQNKKCHERTHTGEKPHRCSFCDKKFFHHCQKKSHERTHTGEKPYKCPHCDKTLSSLSAKISHERTHTGEKPYQCSLCDKKFSTVQNKNCHERTHTGEKPYQCAHCVKKFSKFEHKTRHERTHTGEKPYQCSFCDKSFSRVDHKKCHERVHTRLAN